MTSKREIEDVLCDLGNWAIRKPLPIRHIVSDIANGLMNARMSPRCPHPAVLAQLAADVARLESACLDNRRSCR